MGGEGGQEGYDDPVVPKETGGPMLQGRGHGVRGRGPAAVLKAWLWRAGASISRTTRGFQTSAVTSSVLGKEVQRPRGNTPKGHWPMRSESRKENGVPVLVRPRGAVQAQESLWEARKQGNVARMREKGLPKSYCSAQAGEGVPKMLQPRGKDVLGGGAKE